MKYHARLVFLCVAMGSMCSVSVGNSFVLPADKPILDVPQKTSRNNIFASVKNNGPLPVAGLTPIVSATPKIMAPKILDVPVMDFGPPVPLVAAKQVEPAAKTMVDAEVAPKEVVSQVKPISPKIEAIDENKAPEGPTASTGIHLVPAAEPVTSALDKIIAVEQPEKDEPKEAMVLYQTKNVIDDDRATVAFNFEEASLANLVSYIETIHNIKFITDDIISTAKDAKSFAGHKITFRTNKKLTKKESWDLFLTFLHIAGLDVIPLASEGFYRIVPLARVHTEPIPAFIGVDVGVLPDTDMIVRFVYFAKNVDPAKMKNVIKDMQGSGGKTEIFSGLKALIITDRACAIKSLMQIILELDRAGLPEVLSVIKLKRAIAADVKKLYDTLAPVSSASQSDRIWAPGKKESSLEYFPKNVVLVSDDRTNSLILLGTAKDVQRVEDFVAKHIDVAIDRNAPPIFTYCLQYTNASDVQAILQKIVSYGSSSSDGGPAKYGGVRDGIKYFQPMTIGADAHSNSLIINAVEEDFEALKPLIQELDVAQKQVGLEILMVLVTDVDTKTLGSQISGPNGAGNVSPGSSPLGPTFLQSVTAQTSGIPAGTPIVTTLGTPGVGSDFSLKSSLANLLGGNTLNEVGSILVTFGQPIWAIFKVLKTISSTHIISNPFVVVSNNQPALIKSGQSRQQVSGQVISASALKATGFTPVEATLTVKITPQLTKGNIFNLTISVCNDQFIDATDAAALSGGAGGSPINKKELTTTASVANGETLVLGGIMTETYVSTSTGVPFLENIPVFGWFFKSKTRKISRDHFLIFIAPRLLDPLSDSKDIDDYTDYKLREAQENIDLIDNYDWFMTSKDPVQKAFFGTDHLRGFQELRTGKNFATSMEADKKINHLEVAKTDQQSSTIKRFDKKKQSKQIMDSKKQQKKAKKSKAQQEKQQKFVDISKPDELPPLVIVADENIADHQPDGIKNSISNSMQPGKEK